MIFFSRPKQFNSTLHTEKDFYNAFLKDLDNCKSEVIIESPFITSKRMEYLRPVFQRLLNKGIKIHIITRATGYGFRITFWNLLDTVFLFTSVNLQYSSKILLLSLFILLLYSSASFCVSFISNSFNIFKINQIFYRWLILYVHLTLRNFCFYLTGLLLRNFYCI